MSGNTFVVAYGFEYDKVIINDDDCRIGRTICGNKPVYCALFIEDRNMGNVIEKVKLTEKYRSHYLTDIENLAKKRMLFRNGSLLYTIETMNIIFIFYKVK